MKRDVKKKVVDGSNGSPPSAAWLFAQAILGNPIPNPYAAAERAREERRKLEWLATILPRYQIQLRQLQSAEAEARHKRKMLEWLATVSDRHELELRKLLREEADAREAQQRWEQFYEDYRASLTEWNPNQPRQPSGTPVGGQWAPAGGGGGGSSRGGSGAAPPLRYVPNSKPYGPHGEPAPPEMLELAHAWHQTNELLQHSRRQIEELPARIASESAKIGSGDGYSHLHARNVAQAQRDLAAAKAVVPELEKQSADLRQQYHDLGFDDATYAAWSTGETPIGGRGIEEVGNAVANGGSAPGIKPTGDEDYLVLAAGAVKGIAKAALSKALKAIPRRPLPRNPIVARC